MKKQVTPGLVAETGDRGGVDGDALREGARELIRHDRDVFLSAVDTAKCETDEFDILLVRELNDLVFRVIHGNSSCFVAPRGRVSYQCGDTQLPTACLLSAVR